MTDLKALSDAATQGEWEYRPNEYDDWGVVRGPVNGEYQLRPWIAQFKRAPYEGAELAKHRENGTDPWAGNALFVTALVNEYRAGTIGDTAAAEKAGYARGLREAAAVAKDREYSFKSGLCAEFNTWNDACRVIAAGILAKLGDE